METVLLSYVLSPDQPVYPDSPQPAIEPVSRLSAGDACDTSVLHIFNHAGTHVDGPAHFNPDGVPLAALPIEWFVFRCVGLVDVPCVDDELVTAERLAAAVGRAERCDLLMIRTGFGRVREREGERYAAHSPGLAADAARYILEELPDTRAIALDTISAGAPAHREVGREVHRILAGCGRSDGRFVLIYEDVNLAVLENAPVRVWGWPLLVEGLDSAPSIVVAEI